MVSKSIIFKNLSDIVITKEDFLFSYLRELTVDLHIIWHLISCPKSYKDGLTEISDFIFISAMNRLGSSFQRWFGTERSPLPPGMNYRWLIISSHMPLLQTHELLMWMYTSFRNRMYLHYLESHKVRACIIC